MRRECEASLGGKSSKRVCVMPSFFLQSGLSYNVRDTRGPNGSEWRAVCYQGRDQAEVLTEGGPLSTGSSKKERPGDERWL